MEKVVVIIEREFETLNYKVTNDGEIQLFDYIDEAEKINEVLSKEEVYIKSK